jgi:hypothetical protein
VPVGAGIKIHNRAVNPSWAIRVDARDNVILLETLSTDGGTETEPRHNIEGSVGLSFLFGGGAAQRPEPDSDRDGVPDARDQCLNRPGIAVDARGCPRVAEPDSDGDGVPDSQEAVVPPAEPQVEAEPAAEGPPDEDGDGVADFEDGCPGTPSGTGVGADGCPSEPEPELAPAAADSDGDGVLDSSDACPGTPPGIPVDARGCLARVAPQEPGEEDDEPAAFPVPIAPGVRDAAPAGAGAGGACLDKSTGEREIEFDGRRFKPAGFPQPVDRLFLVQVGSFDGIPLFVSDTAEPPFGDFWVPICGEAGVFDLYVESGETP